MTLIEHLFSFQEIQVNSGFDAILIFKEIDKELEEYLLEKSIDTDSTYGVFDFRETFINCVQEDFDGLIGDDTDKKQFIKALTRIFALPPNTKVDTADKIKRIF